MANIGPNRGNRLRLARQRFAAMLIDEARDISGMTFAELEDALEALGQPRSEVQRYAHSLPGRGGRAPLAASIQGLENRVAALLKRPAHKVLVYRYARDGSPTLWSEDPILGVPAERPDLGDASPFELYLGYEDDWPTYRRLKASSIVGGRDGVSTLELHMWQWGILWDRGVLPVPYTRESWGLGPDDPIEPLLAELVAVYKEHKRSLRDQWARGPGGSEISAGRDTEMQDES